MAFWDNWFKVACPECGQKFAKEELILFEDRLMDEECKEALEAKREQQRIEIEVRRMAEERARAALLDRPINTSNQPFAAKLPGSDGADKF